eukprot:gene33688-45113_t
MRGVLREPVLDPAVKELALTLPSERYLGEQIASPLDPQAVHAVREAFREQMAARLQADWLWAFEAHQVAGAYQPDATQSGQRALANMALQMLTLHAMRSGDTVWPGKAYQRFKDATNMTDRLAALEALVNAQSELATPALARFHEQFKHEPLALDKWFMLQARACEKDGRVFNRVKQLLAHPDFTLHNPNRARALLFTWDMNPAAFHRPDAAGYVLWAEKAIEMDAINPQLASRFARALDRWRNLAEPYRSAAREAIARVAAKPDLSDDAREIATGDTMSKSISLTRYLVEQQRKHGRIPGQLRLLIEVVARACKRISISVNKGALGEVLGSAGSENVQGEVQKKLDIISNEVLIEANEWGGHLAAMASEEMDSIHVVPNRYPQGEYLLLFDPLDGSSNIDVNVSIGTIFSVLRKVGHQHGVSEDDFLQPGKYQAAAGYCRAAGS